jgi:hypothetical protein
MGPADWVLEGRWAPVWAPALRSAPARHTRPRSRKRVLRENMLNATSFSSNGPLGSTGVASYRHTCRKECALLRPRFSIGASGWCARGCGGRDVDFVGAGPSAVKEPQLEADAEKLPHARRQVKGRHAAGHVEQIPGEERHDVADDKDGQEHLRHDPHSGASEILDGYD